MRKKVGIWGTGSAGKRVYAYLKVYSDIVCFYDNDESKIGTSMEGIPVKKWIPEDSSEFIVIASSFYEEIIPLLVQEGLEIFKDFTLYHFIENPYRSEYEILYKLQRCMGGWREEDWIRFKAGKKIVIFHGGCHTIALAYLLAVHTAFREKYKIVVVPHIMYLLPCYDEKMRKVAGYYIEDDNFLNAVDIFFYQLSYIGPGFIDFHLLLPKLSNACKKYALSPLEFFGYFPQCRDRFFKVFCDCRDVNLMYDLVYRDKYIEKLYQQGKTDDEINVVIEDEKFLPQNDVQEFFRVALSILQAAEDDADIKICDYVEEHGRERQLFLDPAHPNGEVMAEYANRVASFLIPDCPPTPHYDFSRALSVYLPLPTVLIYPCVYKALGLKEYYEKAYIVRAVEPVLLAHSAYIHEYLKILEYNKELEEKEGGREHNG